MTYDDDEKVDNLTRVSFDIQYEGVYHIRWRPKNHDDLHS